MEDNIRRKASTALGVEFSPSGSFYYTFFSTPNFTSLKARVEQDIGQTITENQLLEIMFTVFDTYLPQSIEKSNNDVLLICKTKFGNNKFFEQFHQNRVKEFLEGKNIKPLDRPQIISHKKELMMSDAVFY